MTPLNPITAPEGDWRVFKKDLEEEEGKRRNERQHQKGRHKGRRCHNTNGTRMPRGQCLERWAPGMPTTAGAVTLRTLECGDGGCSNGGQWPGEYGPHRGRGGCTCAARRCLYRPQIRLWTVLLDFYCPLGFSSFILASHFAFYLLPCLFFFFFMDFHLWF